MRRVVLSLLLFVVCGTFARAQDAMSFETVQGAWYGWLAGTGMEVKIASMAEGAIAYLKTVQPTMQPFLQELRPTVEGDALLLTSVQAPQPFTMRFHFEGKLLFGEYDDGTSKYTVALARAMPDVETLFAGTTPAREVSAMQAARAEGRQAASANNLQRIGEAFRAFAEAQSDRVFPPMSTTPAQFAPRAESVYPTYIKDPALFIAPGHPDAELLRTLAAKDPLVAFNDESYWYLGYLVPNEDLGRTFLEGYAARAGASTPPDFTSPLKSKGLAIPRLRMGVEELLAKNLDDAAEAAAIAATIPVLIERPGIHEGGSNVLFLDGHVEFLPYPGPFPMTEAFIGGMMELEAKLEPVEAPHAEDSPTAGSP